MSQSFTRRLELILGFAGLCSALMVICAPSKLEGVSELLFPGVLFGALLSVCLWLNKVVHVFWKTVAITVAALIAFPTSVLVGFGVEYYSPFASVHDHAKGFSELSSAALFVGGTVGALAIFATVLFAVDDSGTSPTGIVFRALCWSLAGGILGIVGWNLGPWLGMVLWAFRNKVDPTSPAQRFEDVFRQGTAGMYSLLLVWQTGVGLALGLAVNRTSLGLHQEPAA